ncbi:MAG: universal stress protein, partial [Rhodothermales bacterium]|nr:universal stress protein [Rhodothermales bacterium]
MFDIKSILIPTDFTDSAKQALEEANYLAERYGAKLHILNVLKDDVFDLGDAYDALLQSEIELDARLTKESTELLEKTKPKTPYQDVQYIRSQIRSYDVSEGIVRYANENDIDLIVLGKRKRRRSGLPLIGGTVERVIRHTECPILTVSPTAATEAEVSVNRILVPVDFSSFSADQLTNARELANTYGATVDLLHVIDESSLAIVYGLESAFNFEDLQKRAEAASGKLIDASEGPNVPIEIHVLVGHPAKDTVEFAEANNSDLIVISTH